MLVIDTVKSQPRNNYEEFKRWQNWMQYCLLSNFGKKIEVKGQFTLDDFKSDDHYLDGDGLRISKEEAQAEVDFLNG